VQASFCSFWFSPTAASGQPHRQAFCTSWFASGPPHAVLFLYSSQFLPTAVLHWGNRAGKLLLVSVFISFEKWVEEGCWIGSARTIYIYMVHIQYFWQRIANHMVIFGAYIRFCPRHEATTWLKYSVEAAGIGVLLCRQICVCCFFSFWFLLNNKTVSVHVKVQFLPVEKGPIANATANWSELT
jgi:hypothetical protein